MPSNSGVRIGFTGTRHGMTFAQEESFSRFYDSIPGRVEFHHGDCVGADNGATDIVASMGGAYIVCHPPVDSSHRAYNVRFHEVLPVKTHFARNRDIVDHTDMLVATPYDQTPITKDTKGGTAYTVNYARKRGKRVVIIWPDGRVEDSALSVGEVDSGK